MSGYYGALVATEDRERKINELKKKIIKMYGSSFINFLSYQKPVPVIYRDDSPEIKKAKQEEIQNIIKEREQEYIDREYECLDELNKLILRIRSKNESDPSNNSDFYSASFVPAEAIQQIKCLKCGNKDIENTIRDPIRGDLTCNGVDNQGCGEVLEENTIFSGAEKRNFEGEDERNHHGPAPNKLMPDVVNMETSLFVGVNASSEFKRLTYAHQRLEMDLSKIDKDEKHTRTGYKTRMKKKAFALMEEIGDNLNIHKAVLDQAEEEFAKYRDMKEAVHKFEGTVAACIVIAYEELSKSMKLDDINKSATITSDIALLETSYGHLPSYEEVKDDIAICTIPNINLGKFTIDQAKIWLEAIAQSGNQQKISKHKPTIAQIYIDFQFYGNLLFQFILDEYDKEKDKQSREATTAGAAESGRSRASSVLSNDSSSNTPMETTTAAASFLEKRKREKEDAFKALFGNTTISHRMQQFQKKPTSLNAANGGGGGGGVSRSDLDNFPGKLILKIVPKEIIKQRLLSPRTPTPTSSQSSTTNNAAVAGTGVVLGGAYDENDVEIVHDYFRQAIQRRSSYDKLVAEKQHEHELEAKRINVEESLAISQRKKIIKVYKQEHEKEKQQQQETLNEDSATAMEVEGNESKRRKLNDGDDVKNESKTAGSSFQVKAQSKKKEEEDDVKIEFMDDIDLEELIGTSASKLTSVTTNTRPPVNTAGGSGPKGILKKAGATTGPMVKSSPGTSSTISVKEEKKEVRVGDANHIASVKSGSPESTSSIRPVKVEPGAAPSPSSSSNVAPKPTTAAAAPPKKVGMKPRPKIVIS